MTGMSRRTWALSALAFALLACMSSAVTFDERKPNVYDNYPKIRISGTGIDTLDVSTLELGFAPKLKKGKDYKMDIQSSTNSDGEYITYIALSLMDKKRWIELSAGSQPQPLYLTSAKSNTGTILSESIQIATVVPAPTVTSSDKLIFMGATPRLAINGTNFNTKNTQLFFDPPLQEGVDIQKQILSSTTISLTKIYKEDDPKTWTDEPGPLKVKAINTGAGKMSLSPEDGGVVVAEVQTDNEKHGVSVQSKEISIYQSTKTLEISGTGFLTGMKIRFGNALRGSGTNYTMDVQPSALTLTLQEGSVWRRKTSSLPGALILLAAELGAGWVPLGPVGAKSGQKVATVYEDPTVDSNEASIFRTHTHELVVTGTGFTSKTRPVFDFEPDLDTTRIFQQVMNRTTVVLTLSSDTSQWVPADKLGPLTIKGVDTGAGMVTFDSPIVVATVVADSDVHESGVQVGPNYGQQLYQSSPVLYISGTGFKGEPVLNFDPPIWAPNNYTLVVISDTQLKLTLAQGSKWMSATGALFVKGINVGDGDVGLAAGAGVKVANILEDPVVNEADLQVYASHTKRFPVRGSGFFSADGKSPSILLDGIPSSNYEVEESWNNLVFYLQLLGSEWADVGEGETKFIRLMSINTGAGIVEYPAGVVIAEVRPDSTTAMCEDSCAYANDGHCDEPDAGLPMMPGQSYTSYYAPMGPRGYYGWGYDDDANSFMATNDYSGMYRYAGYSQTYRYYGMTDDGFYNGLASCEIGTDCSDCGVKVTPDGACENTCQHARDGMCDDPRFQGLCPAGTDCQDCGPWGEAYSNFTSTSFYMGSWYADDDDWAYAVDDRITSGQENNAKGVYSRNFEDHKVMHNDAAGAGTIFVDVLWAMVVLVGCSVSIGGCMVAFRHYKAGGGGAPMYLPVQPAEEVELSRRGGASAGSKTTPDVVRIG